jgi:hypothetical protein
MSVFDVKYSYNINVIYGKTKGIIMIKVKFNKKRFKIFASGKIECIENCLSIETDILQDIIKKVEASYHNPSDGFPVSYMAYKLSDFGVEVLNCRDYERENAKPDTVY